MTHKKFTNTQTIREQKAIFSTFSHMGGIIVASLTALYAFLFLFFIIGLVRTHRYKGP